MDILADIFKIACRDKGQQLAWQTRWLDRGISKPKVWELNRKRTTWNKHCCSKYTLDAKWYEFIKEK